jgi:hypothetical protein
MINKKFYRVDTPKVGVVNPITILNGCEHRVVQQEGFFFLFLCESVNQGP